MLKINFKDKPEKSFWLVEESTSLGSGSDCSIQLTGDNIEKRHALILLDGDSATIRYCADTIPVLLNHEPVTHTAPLKHGDIINIGSVELVIENPSLKLDNIKKKAETIASTANSGATQTQEWLLSGASADVLGCHFLLEGEQIIGRDDSCDIVIKLPVMSRKHARVSLQNNGLLISDLGSSNGTYVNNVRVTSNVTAKPFDIISFEKVKFRVEGPKEQTNQTVVGKTITLDEIMAVAEEKEWDTAPASIGNRENTQALKAIRDEAINEDKTLLLKGSMVIAVLTLLLVLAAILWF